MESQTLIIVTVVLLSIVLLLLFYIHTEKIKKLNLKITELSSILLDKEDKLQKAEITKSLLTQQINDLDKSIDIEQIRYINLNQKYNDEINNKEAITQRFEILAQKIIDEKTDRFDTQHTKSIKEILDPLKEKISSFETKIENTHKDNIEKHTSLKTQILHLTDLNERVTKEANNLAKAIKGDNKIQGNWGEMILASVLEKSGLEEGREFFVQKSIKNSDGRNMQPDIIIKLPNNKRIIIDSKVSLKAYDNLVNEEDKNLQKSFLNHHSLSIKSHVDKLADKNYHQLYETESPDFILMFIPIDTAFSSAISHFPDLYTYAFERNIIIVTPATLLATLKTVDSMWSNEKQQRYALDIAKEAGKMYDKLTTFVSDLENVGFRIDQSKNQYEEAMKKLAYGKGNLITRAQKVKKLGAKTSKTISNQWIEYSEEE